MLFEKSFAPSERIEAGEAEKEQKKIPGNSSTMSSEINTNSSFGDECCSCCPCLKQSEDFE